MLDVKHEKTRMELLLGCDANRVATVLCIGVCRVCSQENRGVASVSQVSGDGGSLIHVAAYMLVDDRARTRRVAYLTKPLAGSAVE